MPIMQCKDKEGKSGYKFGESGKCFYYSKDSEQERRKAKQSAILQGVAITRNIGEELELSKEDLKDIKEEQKFDPIVKYEDKHMLFGWAYIAQDKDGNQMYDYSEEFVKEENFSDLEMATYAFNIAFRDSDIRHDCVAKGQLIESMVFSKEKQKVLGIPNGILPQGVWVGFWFEKVEDWEVIKSMSSPMFSLWGKAEKEVIEEV